ncbi:class II fructose-bisphosphate aldolase [Leifsonia sp. F6_8S_P_1B]|uniref:Class II fructose-bisphosphate aldolase n=1 Tax=Leifsonia williamsii TaxID=3035919 RepID=A0ABT8K8K8_9MICO|nr:class II fructose-bisphosphate aldolase [Leifsonia williamsii]MDN4613780.1 class II fructose-bisphosphate aldolase [Leifsonia williamsii]
MTLAGAAGLLATAATNGAAVPSFNVIALEHAEAVTVGAASAGSGALLQLSENAIAYRGSPWPLLAACRELAEASEAPLGIHLDHIADRALAETLIERAERYGVGSIMFDASTLDYAANVAATRKIAVRAHDAGLLVEAELGAIGGKDGAHAPGVRTDPGEAADFVAATGVDALAVAVGSSHAMRDRTAALDLELIARLAAAVPVPLVLHGSSGVPDESIAQAVAAGIRKVNVGTALNVAATAALRAALAARPDAVDPRRYSEDSRRAMAELVASFCAVVREPVAA